MSALRFICFVSGLSAAVACAPGLVYAQADAVGALPIEVTSGTIVEGAAPDTLAIASPDSAIETPSAPQVLTPLDGAVAAAPEVEISPLAPARSLRPQTRDAWAIPVARWDDHPNGPRWTTAVLAALRGPGAPLLQSEPRDIGAWCPGYLDASPAQRAAFWTGLISSLAWHESTHRPGAVGGGGRWFGLVQIAPGTARWRDCDVGSGEALLNGAANLRCGIRIMAITVPRDNVVSEGMRGVAADWGPFHSSRKREDMRNWVSSQPYCEAQASQMRPVMRPVGLGESALPASLDVPTRGDFRPALRPIPRPA